MFCRNCGNQIDDKAVVCIKCGVRPTDGTAHCQACGQPTQPGAVVCVQCGAQLAASSAQQKTAADKKLVAGICGILLGALGVHKFILGYTTPGVVMLLVTIVGFFLTCGIAPGIVAVIGLIEGIIYLTKSDEDFVRTYIDHQRHWF
jgi:TM2 domain-containing membrane protein YozV